MHKTCIALGANLYDPEAQFIAAIRHMAVFLKNIRMSSFYRTKPMGVVTEKIFFNMVVCGQTTLEPQPVLEQLLLIEQRMGRDRTQGQVDRIIDLDLIFVDDLVIDASPLTLPHPRMHERDFVLQPLSELEPNWQHPVMHKSVDELLAGLSERSID